MIKFTHRGFEFMATDYKINPGFKGNREEPPEDPEVEIYELAIYANGWGYTLPDAMIEYLLDDKSFYDALMQGEKI